MADRNITLAFGLTSVACKSEVAKITPPTLSHICEGQPGHPAHDPLPRRAPYTCEKCGPLATDAVLKRGVKSGKTYTIVDADAAQEAKQEYALQYKGLLNLVPHNAEEFLFKTGQGDTIHYLTPASAAGEGHYQLLVRLVSSHPELAFAGLFTPATATSLFQLTVRSGVLVLVKRTREQALKPLPSVGGEVDERWYAALEGALESFVEPYDPATYEDTYAVTLADLIDAGETVSVGAEVSVVAPTVENADDIIAALTALATKKTAKKATTRKKAS